VAHQRMKWEQLNSQLQETRKIEDFIRTRGDYRNENSEEAASQKHQLEKKLKLESKAYSEMTHDVIKAVKSLFDQNWKWPKEYLPNNIKAMQREIEALRRSEFNGAAKSSGTDTQLDNAGTHIQKIQQVCQSFGSKLCFVSMYRQKVIEDEEKLRSRIEELEQDNRSLRQKNEDLQDELASIEMRFEEKLKNMESRITGAMDSRFKKQDDLVGILRFTLMLHISN
jgi:chromosome segregation ATPase